MKDWKDDRRFSPDTFRGRLSGYVENFKTKSDEDDGITHVDFTNQTPSNVVTSRIIGNLHGPVLDLDYEAHLEPSSTPGHHHLYLEKNITWQQYLKLLSVMAEIGLIEPGYFEASKKRGYTTVRLPWVTKDIDNNVPADPQALQEWVDKTLNG